jgi:hypothetical protein
MMREEDNMPLQGIGQWVKSKFLHSRKGRFHQRAEGLGEHMLQLQQGAEIRPCIELEKVGSHRQGEKGGEPSDAHQRLTLCSPCSRGCGC